MPAKKQQNSKKQQKKETEKAEEEIVEEQKEIQQKKVVKQSKQTKKEKVQIEENEEEQLKKTKKVKKVATKTQKKEESDNDNDDEEEEEEQENDDGNLKSEQMTRKEDVLGDGKIDKQKITISSWNINGLRAVEKDKNLSNYIKEYQPDIICLNELKVEEQKYNKEQLSTFIPKDYFAYMNFCKPPQQGYAGSAILSKFKPISVKYDIGKKKHDQEGRTITVEFEKFYLVTCYVPNAGEGLKRLKYRTKEWDPDFKAYLNELKAKKHTILCGDLNCAHREIDIFNPKGNLKTAGFTVEERAEFTKLLESGFVDTFRRKYPTSVTYSFWSYRSGARKTNKGWRLDYFLTNEEFFKDNVEDIVINEKIMGSDHCPIELKIKF